LSSPHFYFFVSFLLYTFCVLVGLRSCVKNK
jgi:hypothetical protein